MSKLGKWDVNGSVMRASRPGFSLLELTLVLVIMGMLMAVAAVSLVGNAKRARAKTTKASMTVINGAIKNYMLEKAGSPPPTLDTLVPGYLEEGKMKDSWKEPFFYSATATSSGHEYQLISKGDDKELGTDDDINVWTMNDED